MWHLIQSAGFFESEAVARRWCDEGRNVVKLPKYLSPRDISG
jgi:hypothetical protein